MVSMVILANSRNRLNNIFQTIISLFLFGSNAGRAAYSIFNRLGVCVSYSVTVERLHALADHAQQNLHEIGRVASEEKRDFFYIIYDNINKHLRAWFQSLGSEDYVQNGTAATIVMMKNVQPSTLNPEALVANRAKNQRATLTVKQLSDDINSTHLENIAVGLILRILVQHIASLAHHAPEIENCFKSKWAVRRLPLEKTEIHSLPTTAIDESTTSGNRDLLHQIVTHDLGMLKRTIAFTLWLVGGDLLSVDRLRKIPRITEKHDTAFDRNQWVVPVVQLWHMKWAFLRSIFRLHWRVSTTSHAHGLAQDSDQLGRKINPKKVDFYPSHRLVEVRFHALVLGALRYVLRTRSIERQGTT
jgi:hypothetical protein